MLTAAEMRILRAATATQQPHVDAAASRYDKPQTRVLSGAPELPPPAPAPMPPSVPAGEQFELTVPEGYVGGEELPVMLPDGREVVVGVPDGLAAGDEFIAIIPV